MNSPCWCRVALLLSPIPTMRVQMSRFDRATFLPAHLFPTVDRGRPPPPPPPHSTENRRSVGRQRERREPAIKGRWSPPPLPLKERENEKKETFRRHCAQDHLGGKTVSRGRNEETVKIRRSTHSAFGRGLAPELISFLPPPDAEIGNSIFASRGEIDKFNASFEWAEKGRGRLITRSLGSLARDARRFLAPPSMLTFSSSLLLLCSGVVDVF